MVQTSLHHTALWQWLAVANTIIFPCNFTTAVTDLGCPRVVCRKGKHPATIARYDKHGNGVSCSSSRSGSSSSSSNSKASTRCQLVHGVKVKRGKLQEFYDHADQSNDIFRVAAEVIAISIIRADHLIQQQQQQPQADTEQTASRQPQLADPSSGQQQGGAGREEQQQQQTAQAVAVANHSDSVCEASEYSSLLQAAFLPFAVGHKGVWWEGVAVPDDEDDEAEFRAQIRYSRIGQVMNQVHPACCVHVMPTEASSVGACYTAAVALRQGSCAVLLVEHASCTLDVVTAHGPWLLHCAGNWPLILFST